MNTVNQYVLPVSVGGERQSKLNGILSVIIAVLAFLAVFITVFNYTYCCVYVVESSMSPTFTGAKADGVVGGDYVYAEMGADFTYGDVVIISVNEGSVSRMIIKRVVAMGGDKLYLDKGKLYVDFKGDQEGFVLVDEPYAVKNNPNLAKNTMAEVSVPEGTIFVLGDNRDVSKDSRDDSYGCIDQKSVFAVVPEWSIRYKDVITGFNTFIKFTLPSFFGVKK